MENQLIDKWGEWIDVASLAVGDSDVYVKFKSKRVNLTVLYGEMMDDLIEYVQSDEFLGNKNNHDDIASTLRKYTTKKYGISIEWAYNKLINNNNQLYLKTDKIFQLMIDRVGGVEKIDWIKMYNSFQFRTSNESILIYIANEILKGDIYEYFVNNYNLRIDGVKFIKVDKNHKLTNASFIVLKWDINNIESKERVIQLGKLISNKRDWWHEMTSDNSTKRGNIVDYDKLLNGRDENEVLPNRCPIDNNIILNYTSIDFSGGNQNKNECKNNTDLNETWSAASIDRIDSTKEYAYDNIQIISYYYNSLKNCGSFEQLDKLYKHQSKIKSELYPIEYMI